MLKCCPVYLFCTSVNVQYILIYLLEITEYRDILKINNNHSIFTGGTTMVQNSFDKWSLFCIGHERTGEQVLLT